MRIRVTIALAGLAISIGLQAAPTTYTSEADFLNAVTPTAVESFEDEPEVFDVTTVTTDLLTITTLPLDGGTSRLIVDKLGGSPTSLHATDGVSFMHSGSVTNDSWLLTFELDTPVVAVAFDLTDASERLTLAGKQSIVKFSNGNSDEAIISTCPPCLTTGAETFFGFYSPGSPFTTFSVLNTAFSDGVGFDNIQLVQAAPTLACVGFQSPLDKGAVAVHKNRVLPFQALLIDEDGNPVDELGIAAAPVIQIWFDSGTPPAADVSYDALPAGAGTEGNQFEFLDSEWRFNLKTKNYSGAGTYTTKMLSGDANEYLIDPSCVAEFVVY